MQPGEVRIGNLVYAFKTVWSIDSTDFRSNQISTYQPIPLTKEWLQRLGFEWANIDECYFKGSSGVVFGKDLLCGIGEDYHNVKAPHIKYVHQLQNLYFSVTGEELTMFEKVEN